MRGFFQMLSYKFRVWLARRWADPQLAWLAERHGGVMVTSERFGKVLLPIYHIGVVGEFSAELAHRLHKMTEERDYWRSLASDKQSKEGQT